MSLFGLKYHQRIEIEKMFKNEAEKKNSVKKKSDKETTTKQQLLILQYLGIIDFIDLPEYTKKSKLLSLLLNRNEQNIREDLPYIGGLKVEGSTVKTIANLNAILPHFEELGLNKVSEEIRTDLEKLKAYEEKIKRSKTL